MHAAPAPLPPDGGTWSKPAGTSWPAAGVAQLALVGATAHAASGTAGGVPVAVAARAGKQTPKKVTVSVLDRTVSQRLGVSGPVITVDGDPGEVDATVDYAGFQQLYGGGWADRLTLRKLPSCAGVADGVNVRLPPDRPRRLPHAGAGIALASAPVNTAHGLAPGAVLVLGNADYCYGIGELKLRVDAVLTDLDAHPDAEWVRVVGLQILTGGFEQRREVEVRASAIPRCLQPGSQQLHPLDEG